MQYPWAPDILSSIIDKDGDWLLYDGECPFCSRYVALLQLRRLSPRFQLLDARNEPELVRHMVRLGHDVDTGMVLRWQGRYYHGADCIAELSRLTTTETVGQRLNQVLFADRGRARLLYPWLVRGRNLVLRLLGRRPIGANAGHSEQEG